MEHGVLLQRACQLLGDHPVPLVGEVAVIEEHAGGRTLVECRCGVDIADRRMLTSQSLHEGIVLHQRSGVRCESLACQQDLSAAAGDRLDEEAEGENADEQEEKWKGKRN